MRRQTKSGLRRGGRRAREELDKEVGNGGEIGETGRGNGSCGRWEKEGNRGKVAGAGFDRGNRKRGGRVGEESPEKETVEMEEGGGSAEEGGGGGGNEGILVARARSGGCRRGGGGTKACGGSGSGTKACGGGDDGWTPSPAFEMEETPFLSQMTTRV